MLRAVFASAMVWCATATVCEQYPDPSGGGLDPIIMPPPKSLTPTSYSMKCQEDAPGQVYNNDLYADGSGPRGAHNSSECCALCAANDGCNYWSFNVDPELNNVTEGACRWGALTWCCFFHSAATNLTTLGPEEPSNQFGAKGKWTSGSVSPTVAQSRSTSAELQVPVESGMGPQKLELQISTYTTAIVAADPSLLPLTQLLSDDIFMLSGIRINASSTVGTGVVGDISFALLPAAEHMESSAAPPHLAPDGEKYSVVIDGRGVRVSCTAYIGCAWGVTTLLQTMCIAGVPHQTAAFPSYNLTDWPDAPCAPPAQQSLFCRHS